LFRTHKEYGHYLKGFRISALSAFISSLVRLMSLLQDVLRSTAVDSQGVEIQDDSDDDLVNVVSLLSLTSSYRSAYLSDQVSLPGTPDRTRPSSPVRGASSRPLPGPLHITSRRDLLKVLPTEINQRIFSYLPIRDLARCALVSRKWNRSQTINYGIRFHIPATL
jgi:hypothetical protein